MKSSTLVRIVRFTLAVLVVVIWQLVIVPFAFRMYQQGHGDTAPFESFSTLYTSGDMAMVFLIQFGGFIIALLASIPVGLIIYMFRWAWKGWSNRTNNPTCTDPDCSCVQSHGNKASTTKANELVST